MKARVGFSVIALIAGFSLSACGGSSGGGGSSDSGSSGSSGSSSPVNPIVLPTDGNVTLSGNAVTANFSNDATGFEVDGINGSGSSTLRLTTESGEIVEANFSGRGSSVGFDATDDRVQDGVVVGFDTVDRNDGALLIDPSRSRFEYQTFGVWLEGRREARGTAGAGTYGSRTPSGNIPTGRNATFDGVSAGVARLSDGDPYLTASEIDISTNFRTATITSSGTQASNLGAGADRAAPELDFSGTGNVSGNSFTANVSGTGTSGTANGFFYGPDADEVGGTFSTTGAGGVSYIGAYGAD